MRYRQDFTIFKRGKFWYYRVYDNNGVRTTAHSTGQTVKTLALEWCKAHFSRGLLQATYITFGEVAETVYNPEGAYVKSRGLSQSSIRTYHSWLNNIIYPKFKEVRLSDITTSMIEEFVSGLAYSDSAKRNILNIFKVVCKRAMRDKILVYDPAEAAEFHRTLEARDAFTTEEVKALVSQAKEDKALFSLVMLMALCGLRTGEALALSEEKFKTEGDHLYISVNEHYDIGSKKIVPGTKTGPSRQVPIILELQLLPQYGYKYFTPRIKKLMEIIPEEERKRRKLSLYSLRHFFVTQAKKSGVNPLIVEVLVGHSLKGMSGVYTNFHLEDLSEICAWQRTVYNQLIMD